jgi:hypothetical protein
MLGRTKKILVWSVVAAVIAASFFLLYSRFKNQFIHEAINKVNNGDGFYKIAYDSLYLDEVNGELYILNLKVTPDTALFTGHDWPPNAPASLISVTAAQLRITGVKTPQALLNKEVSGRRIVISDVDVTLYKLKKDTSGEDNESLQSIMYNDVLSRLKFIQVDTMSLERINFRLVNFHKHRELLSASNASVSLYNVRIDSNSVMDSSHILFSQNIAASVEKVSIKSNNGRYKYDFAGIELSSFNRSLYIKEFNLIPAFSESVFMEKLKTQNDRFDFRLANISLTQIDFSRVTSPALAADSLVVEQGSFKIYRDLNVPRDSASRLDQYPHQVVMKIPFDVVIKKTVLRNSFIEYKERGIKSKNSGKVQFYKVNAAIDNITNEKKALAKNGIATLDFNASFLNRAPIKARVAMRLGDQQGRFTIKGSMGKIRVEELNQLTEPMGLAKMEKGTINKMEFDIAATKYHSNGTLVLLYDDLKISLLKKDDDDNSYKKKGLASFAANVIVKNANPIKDKVREAHIDYDRNLNRSFFNIIWKSIFAGIKESVGMPQQ